ncbi:spindle pole body interacting protein [Ascobolus immersus RN42]|uniref:Spindle pole body interacting protein n=1 Tax=Ascobolus immersus RN42 TaxID=1160509 RepID=A0A3N4IKB2_ASCIM|nr:spindle pole body interacting protein [Ascobolus immersus RN42]
MSDKASSIQRYSGASFIDNPNPHVEYILVAEFALKGGPSMEHQYPTEIRGDEHTLAELMLPDQIHKRESDWTIFFLHKSADQVDPNAEQDPTGMPPLVYVLNLVMTKYEKDAVRGARCKAMAICTRHSFLHIYKPILLLALEEYFKSPTLETLAEVYESVNSMDLSAMPELSTFERHILSMSDNKEMFVEKFEEAIQRIQGSQAEEDRKSGPGVSSPDDTTSQSYIDLLQGRKKPLGRLQISRDTHEFETKVVYGKIPVPIKIPVAVMPETVGDFSLIQLITTFHTPHAQNPQPFALHPHLTTNGPFTHPIIILINALLTEKRIIFLGHNKPSGLVADHVLAACALASGGILRGFTRHAFPYTDLSKIDELLRVQGFIAGVTNPNFANKPEWWDVLCDIQTGRIKISPRLASAASDPSPSSSLFSSSSPSIPDTGDNAFMESILHSITSRYGERAIRTRFRDWIARFIRLAAAFEEAVYGASALWVGSEEDLVVKGHGQVWPDEISKNRDLQANLARIEGWRQTRSYYAYIQDLVQQAKTLPIKSLDLQHHITRLRTLPLTPADSARLYIALNQCVVTYEEINQFLCHVPENQGGLHPIALGLFHPDPKARQAVVELLERIGGHVAGKHFFGGLGRWYRLAFVRLKGEMVSKGGELGSPRGTPGGLGMAMGDGGLTMGGLSLS